MKTGAGLKWHRKVLGILRDLADASGVVQGMSFKTICKSSGIRESTFGDAVNLLIAEGELDRVAAARGVIPGIYRLTGKTSARDASIESVIRLVPNRKYDGCAGELPTTPVSLPRVRFLERTIA